MKIAGIGSGIAGSVVSYLLAADHDLTVVEQNDHLGGHANTVRVDATDATDGVHDVDTGFIVFNEERYSSFVRRFLDVFGQPEWRVVRGGSRRYVEKLTASFRERIRTSTPVTCVRGEADHVLVTPRGGAAERFDQVVVASHGDEALAMLADATPEERDIHPAFPRAAVTAQKRHGEISGRDRTHFCGAYT